MKKETETKYKEEGFMKVKRLLSAVLATVMVMSLMPMLALNVSAAELQINSVHVVGTEDLIGVNWLVDEQGEMTETQNGVYEITFNNVDEGVPQFNFLINGSWDDYFGGNNASETADYKSNDHITFLVDSDNSTVKIVLDLRKFDYDTKLGAIYKLYVNGVQINASEKNITLDTAALSGYDSVNGYKYVYYGTYENSPIKWRILTMNGNGGTYKNGDGATVEAGNAMFLLSEYALKKMAYEIVYDSDDGDGQTNPIDWRYSDAWYWCNDTEDDTSFIGSSFTKAEKACFLKTSKANEAIISDNKLQDDIFFFLSETEAESDYINGNCRTTLPEGGACVWWTRAPSDRGKVSIIDDEMNGMQNAFIYSVVPAARPAFNLDTSKILFTSAAVGGKNTDNVGNLSANGANSTGEYKLTMIDESRNFAIYTTSLKGEKGECLRVYSSGTTTGANEYISAIITDDDGEVLYYGQVYDLEMVYGELSGFNFTIPSDIDYGTYEVKFFNERINGDYKTDISSDFQKCSLEVVKPKATFETEPKANTLTYNGAEHDLITGGYSNEGEVKYSTDKNGTYSTDIPKGINAGRYTVWYYIEGDSAHSDSDKAYVEVTIEKGDSETKVTGEATVTYGDTLTLTATVGLAKAKAVGVNEVEFYVGEDEDYLGSAEVENGTAVLEINTVDKKLEIGENIIAAQYGGSVNLNGSSDGTIIVTLEKKEVDLTWNDYEDLVYDGTEKNVTATATGFESGDDVRIESKGGREKDAGDYTATAELAGEDAEYYALSAGTTLGYSVKARAVEIEWTVPSNAIYNRKPYSVTAKVTNAVDGDSVNLTLKENVKTNKGDYTAEATGTDDKNYTLTGAVNTTCDWTIEAKSIEGASISLKKGLVYNGSEQEVEITEVKSDDLTLTGEDYDIFDNVGRNADIYTVRIEGKGNFVGTAEEVFEIKPLTIKVKWRGTEGLWYDGEEKTIEAVIENVLEGDDVRLVTEGDFAATDAEEYEARITDLEGADKDNYTLEGAEELEKKWVISQTDDNEIWNLRIDDWTYGEVASVPSAEAKYGEAEFVYSKDASTGWTKDVPTDAGRWYVKAVVTGTKDYAEKHSDAVEFNIWRKDITGATHEEFEETVYNGKEQSPKAKVWLDEEEVTGQWSPVTNVDDLTTFTAEGNFEGTIENEETGMKRRSIGDATVETDGTPEYNGEEQTQKVKVSIEGFENVTFDVTDNVQTDVNTEGSYTLHVTGNGNFEGTKDFDWNIAPCIPKENPDKKTTAKVRKKKALDSAKITKGVIWGIGEVELEGVFLWSEGDKIMNEDGEEEMTFVPNDKNYAPLVITAEVKTYSSGGGGGSATVSCTVTFESNGGIRVESQSVNRNGKATEPNKPEKEGYIFEGWYTDRELENEYDFGTKVTDDITLYAKWAEEEVEKPNENDNDEKTQTEEWENPFADVEETDWFFESVKYVHENGLMNGVTKATFEPEGNLTRGMLVAILYRAEGEPEVNRSIPFEDVKGDMYYCDAVIWAQQNGIVNGVSETKFAPDENITREQTAAIMYRYAKYKGYDVTQGGMQIREFEDFESISEYAVSAMTWAVNTGLMKGKTENEIKPKDNATRCEIAAIIQRFIEING